MNEQEFRAKYKSQGVVVFGSGLEPGAEPLPCEEDLDRCLDWVGLDGFYSVAQLKDIIKVIESREFDAIKSFNSKDTYTLSDGRTVYVVPLHKHCESRDDVGLVGEVVLIDGLEYTVEAIAHVVSLKAGTMIGLIVG